METGQVVIIVIEFLLGIIIGLIAFIVKSMLKRVEGLEVDVKTMKDNYLNRFEIVIDNQNRVKEELIKHNTEIKDEAARQFSELKVAIAEVTGLVKNQADFCHYVQSKKTKVS